MATVSAHVLSGLDGTHVGGLDVSLVNLTSGRSLFRTKTDSHGRLSEVVDLHDADPGDRYELVFHTLSYWRSVGINTDNCIQEIVLRFLAPDSEARYHRPVILSPHSYSAWASLPE